MCLNNVFNCCHEIQVYKLEFLSFLLSNITYGNLYRPCASKNSDPLKYAKIRKNWNSQDPMLFFEGSLVY